MKLISEAPIAVKIAKMHERVRWQNPLIQERGIDQTRLVIDDGIADNPEFSFLVMGDTLSELDGEHDPQRQVAELILAEREACRFVLHTGDVVYSVGSKEYYQRNFIEPYREFLVGGENYKRLTYDRMVFNQPFLPVLGNHDYYDVPYLAGLISGSTLPLRRLLNRQTNPNIGWHGSHQGQAYAEAFLDYLMAIASPEDLARHLDKYYTAKTDTGLALSYKPGSFTRLPNRYYTFRSGGIDFFALDSSTFNVLLPHDQTSDRSEKQRHELEQEKQQILAVCQTLSPDLPEAAEKLAYLRKRLQQIEHTKTQLENDQATIIDFEQLDWLRQKLIASWNNPEVRGRVIYLHHPPYVTEATKWSEKQTLGIRRNLRRVFDHVVEAVGSLPPGRPLINLILSGHAHCFEYLRTVDTGHGDSDMNCIICGGSGFSIRRQREEGSELIEYFSDTGERRLVAKSHLFVGRHGEGSRMRRPHSCLRIDVQPGDPLKFIIRPLVTELIDGKWHNQQLKPFEI